MKTSTKEKIAKRKAAKIDKVNKEAVLQKVIVNRELKFKYPEEITDTLARKAFRQKVRNTIRRMERNLGKFEGTKVEKIKLKKSLHAFRKENLMIESVEV